MPHSPPPARRAASGVAAAVAAVTLLAGCGGPPPLAASHHAPLGAPLASAPPVRPMDGAAERPARAPRTSAQYRAPLEALGTYLNGFHFYTERPDLQTESHHWCSALDAEVAQCVVFDGSGRGAKLTGVKYVIASSVWAQLPPGERELWHSQAYEVRSGQLVAPGLGEADEHALMRRLVDTYAKTWTTWQSDAGSRVPVGVPQRMQGFSADGQADDRMLVARDLRLGRRTAGVARNRTDIAAPRPVAEGATRLALGLPAGDDPAEPATR